MKVVETLNYTALEKLNDDDLKILDADATDQMYHLQKSQDKQAINFWTSLSAFLKITLRKRKNG